MTLKTFLAAAGAAALAMSVSGCNQNASSQSVTARDCTPFPKADVVSNDPSTAFEDCVHRWSYALARARDPADVVAQAAVDACNDDLTKWNEQALNQSPAGSAETAPSLTNGSPTDAMGSHAQYAQSRALFYVVQARAGNCAAPPSDRMVEANPPATQGPAANPNGSPS